MSNEKKNKAAAWQPYFFIFLYGALSNTLSIGSIPSPPAVSLSGGIGAVRPSMGL
jgi:hypothetical protein